MLFEYKVKLNHGCHYRLACVILCRIPAAISFDHDLGEGLTGYDVMKRIEQWVIERGISSSRLKAHSVNPVGRQNIEAVMKAAKRLKS